MISFLICVGLVVLVWIIFGQTLGHDFVNYDDDDYIQHNPVVANGLSWEGIAWPFTHVHSSNWHPLTSMSHMLDCQLYGFHPWGHHLTNVILHAAAAVFLFLALFELTAARWPSAFVAALFAIHPLHVESVAWVAERKDVLSGLFFMLILWTYARYAHTPRPGWGQYTVVIVLSALGLMCKPTLVTLPFVLLLLDYWPLRRLAPVSSSSVQRIVRAQQTHHRGEALARGSPVTKRSISELLVEKIPFFFLSIVSCVATVLAQQRAVVAIRQLTFEGRVGNAIVSYVVYVWQLIWPTELAVIYPYRPGYPTLAQVLLALVVLVIISVVVVVWRGRYPYLLVGWLWFLGVLVPMIGLVQVGAQVRADRYTYLSHIGLYILVTWGAVELLGKWRGGRPAVIVAALLILTGLTAVSYLQASTWQNSETMWNQALTSTTGNYIAENNLGNALMKKGQPEQAVVHFRKALEINPDYSEGKYHLAFALGYLAGKDNKDQAIASFQEAIRIEPDHANARHNLAVLLAGQGRIDEAVEQFREALRLEPDYFEARCNFAAVLAKLGRRDEAIAQLREALRIRPEDENVKAQLRKVEAGN